LPPIQALEAVQEVALVEVQRSVVLPLLERLYESAVKERVGAGGGMMSLFAEHDAVVPPPLPLHDQFQGPVPETLLADPLLQRLEIGALENV
jgi:hypothetical protein